MKFPQTFSRILSSQKVKFEFKSQLIHNMLVLKIVYIHGVLKAFAISSVDCKAFKCFGMKSSGIVPQDWRGGNI